MFAPATFSVEDGDRVGLVGPNGAGKTTLLRILAGELEADSGELVRPRDHTVGYLAQEVKREGARTVVAEVMDAAEGLREIEREMREIEAKLDTAPDDAATLAERHGELAERFRVLGGYDLEARAREILHGLGFTGRAAEQPLTTLSGGWVMRVELARLLLVRPDLLLLDEPTNHLDLESLAWLEGFLSRYPGAVVVVSHDRFFLNRMVSRIAELGPDGLFVYEGDYDAYVEARAELEARLAKEAMAHERRRKEIQAFVDRFRAKATKARQAQSRVKLLEKMEANAPAKAPARPMKRLALSLPEPVRAGEVVLTLSGAVKRYGETAVYDGLDLTVRRGARVALVGENGAGKSTLLGLLSGRLLPDDGRRVVGHKAETYYFAQHQAEALDPGLTVLETLRAVMPTDPETRVRGILGAFLFTGDDVDKRVRVLSGGEKSRLALARMLARPANVLLLDEPTNHLDLAAREVLESALAAFTGTIVFISHDRYFINRVATSVLEVRRGGIVTEFPGDYDAYTDKRARLDAEATARAPAQTKSAAKPMSDAARERERKKAEAREAGKRRKAAEKLEAEITGAEARVAEIDGLLCDPAIHADGERTRALLAERAEIETTLEGLYESWAAHDA